MYARSDDEGEAKSDERDLSKISILYHESSDFMLNQGKKRTFVDDVQTHIVVVGGLDPGAAQPFLTECVFKFEA